MTDLRHISSEDLALHAMQALLPEESAAINAHLAQCDPCRDELASLSGDLALVALGVDQRPLPAGARDRFLEKLSPFPGADSDATTAGVVSITSRQPNRAAIWVPWLATAALLILSISLGFEVQRLRVELQDESAVLARQNAAGARAQQVLEVLSAPTAQRVVLAAAMPPAPAPTGRAIYLPARGGLIFQGNDLARLSEDKTYELWVIPANGSAPIPAGLFRPDGAGNATVVLPPLPIGIPAKAFGVTIEKAGGSTTPTAPIILAGSAPAPGE